MFSTWTSIRAVVSNMFLWFSTQTTQGFSEDSAQKTATTGRRGVPPSRLPSPRHSVQDQWRSGPDL